MPLLIAVAAASAFAQTDQGRITGNVLDPTGAAVASATLEVQNQETGATSRVGASSTGNYVVVVPAGTYKLTVTAAGFKQFVRENITVPVATTVGVDATLEIGATSESVTVVESTPILKTESGEVSYNVQTKYAG